MKLLQKIKQRIVSSPKHSCNQPRLSDCLSSIAFNPSVHGDNVRISADGQFAKRTQSFCKAIVFTSRPLLINEPITFQVSSVSLIWSGSIRVGFSAVDPNQIRGRIPRYMCPELTNLRGFYAKALPDHETQMATKLTFWINEYGQMMYKINDQNRGVFLNIDPMHRNTPMWAMVDVYGLVTSIKIIQSTKQSNTDMNALCRDMARLPASSPSSSLSPLSKFHANAQINPIAFHSTAGSNIRFSSNRSVAVRNSLSSNQGYVFTERPLQVNELLLIQILRLDALHAGNLAFGLTTCPPSKLNSTSLPDDSHRLLDRPEYWIVIKDVIANAQPGDELGFCINERNQVQLVKNDLPPVTLIHVDSAHQFYAFFDLFGRTKAIRVLGTKPLARSSRSSSLNENNFTNQIAERNQLDLIVKGKSSSVDCSKSVSLKKLNNEPPQEPNANSECIVCFEKNINSVLYQCGHMCMCYDCAMKQWQRVGGGQCPICRAFICDVIRTYWS